MSDELYERYKDALRRGHVAALRGGLEAALVAYREAAAIAPDRALPHVSLGSVFHRLGREPQALAAFGAALERAPRDEAALAGRAEVLATLGRRADAANDLDLLAEMQERAGRLPEACDTARRALELAESRARRRQAEGIARRLREIPADAAAVAALERALSVLDPAATMPQPVPEPEPEPDGPTLTAEAEDRLDVGDSAGARERFLAAAAVHRAAGELDAAIDACYLALSIAPADPELHIALAELYIDRGWRGPATQKLLLLDRLVALGEDQPVRARIRALAADRLGDMPALAALNG